MLIFSSFRIGFVEVRPVAVIDVLLLGLLLYCIYQFTEESALRILTGFGLLSLSYLAVKTAEMQLLTSVLSRFTEVGTLAAIILFQKEIRKLLFWVGGVVRPKDSKLARKLLNRNKDKQPEMGVISIVEASKALAGSNTGAIIVISSSGRGLRFYEESGEAINALISKRLLLAIFNKHSPLHDGGVIIYNNKIVTARGILPVTEARKLPSHLGLRHRAAIGMTEKTDTLVLVISEETGQISIARNGQLANNLSIQETRTAINDYLHGSSRRS